MDFVEIGVKHYGRNGDILYPDFKVDTFTDLMVRGTKFYAIWDEQNNIWSTNEKDVARLVDEFLDQKAKEYEEKYGTNVTVNYMRNFSSSSWTSYKKYVASLPDIGHQLDTKLTFLNSKTKKEDYVSKCLPYALLPGDYSAYDELMSTLYSEEEREKLEWAIGAIVAGDSVKIQKFIVLYGDAGSGKSTVLNIIQQLFNGYYGIFDAKALTSSSDSFATEAFRSNPLVGIQHDGDLSKIEDNSTLNSIVSHEEILIKEKYKSGYPMRMNAFLFMASNKPVKITDGKSGLLRRLIDVHPTGEKLPPRRYSKLMKQIESELGAIASHCLDVYQNLGKNYYNTYKPTEMMFKTDIFYNFVDDNYFEFEQDNCVTLKAAYASFKNYCAEGAPDYKLPMYKFREELKNYFDKFDERILINGKQVRSLYQGFRKDKFPQYGNEAPQPPDDEPLSEVERRDISEDLNMPLILDKTQSLLDDILSDCPAQYSKKDKFGNDIPKVSWGSCRTTLKSINTKELHYVKPPVNHIVIDFDIKDSNGEKSSELNLIEAAKWPATYAEFSKGGSGVHLHYIYDGDPLELANKVKDDVEIKVFSGLSSLRRRLSFCNDIQVAHLEDGFLPKKGAKVINEKQVKDEEHLRNLIEKHLRKEIVPSTRQSIDLINDILNKAYNDGLEYDLSNMEQKIKIFAARSTHQSKYCIDVANNMKYQGKGYLKSGEEPEDTPIAFFDIEVFPEGYVDGEFVEALLIVNWKFAGLVKHKVVRMINPTREAVKALFNLGLIGFNCRRYDNHILYAYVYEGYTVQELYRLSDKIINGGKAKDNRNYFFGPAYNLSKTDLYDLCSKKQSLKKWEIEIAKKTETALEIMSREGLSVEEAAEKVEMSAELLQLYYDHPELKIRHKELNYRWDKPVPKDKWIEVAEYCDNDVLATEAVFIERQADWKAREIQAALSGLSVNDTTNQHTTRFIFGDNTSPQDQFNYRNMAKADVDDESKIFHYNLETFERVPGDDGSYSVFYEKDGLILPVFPGYTFENGVSTYRGEVVGEGGYVYSEPGMYVRVGLMDIASMHPSSIVAEQLFGPEYTKQFEDILKARIAIKHGDFETAKKMFDGKLIPFLDDIKQAKSLSQALKIIINRVYGLTSASFKNPFRDPRNIDNIVAKRGALFMINLKHEVQKRGYKVVHIKTDSIKIPDADDYILDFVVKYGKLYGYNFEHECTYDRMCLVNDAVYIAKEAPEYVEEGKTPWTATGAEFQVPYIFKTLFSKEPINFYDMCETKTVTTALYLDMNENLPDVTEYEKELDKLIKKQKKTELTSEELSRMDILNEEIAKGHCYEFVGRAGLFAPIKPGCGGGELVREKDGKFTSAGGAKGYRWLEASYVQMAEKYDDVDVSYYDELTLQAKRDISEYGSFDAFVSDEPLYSKLSNKEVDYPPWEVPCGSGMYKTCIDCPKCNFHEDTGEWLCDDHYDIDPIE